MTAALTLLEMKPFFTGIRHSFHNKGFAVADNNVVDICFPP